MFRLCEHYDDNQPINYHNYNYNDKSCIECFVCFEYKTESEDNPIHLIKQNMYITKCKCDGSVHNKCLQIWFYSNMNCPICRKSVVEKNATNDAIYRYVPVNFSFKKSITKITLLFLLMYVMFDFYVFIIYTKRRFREDFL